LPPPSISSQIKKDIGIFHKTEIRDFATWPT